MTEIEIGRGKRGRTAYSFDDIAIVPSRRTRDPEEVSIAWQIDAYRFELPILAAPMDSVMSPETAIAFGRAGGLGVLNLEGIFTRYADAEKQLEKIASFSPAEATSGMQEIYARPVEPKLIARRIEEIKASGVLAAGSLTLRQTGVERRVGRHAPCDARGDEQHHQHDDGDGHRLQAHGETAEADDGVEGERDDGDSGRHRRGPV